MPKLVCDRPADSEQVEYYTLVGLPGNPRSPLSSNLKYGVEYDLKDISPGTYNLRVSACNAWKCSLPSPLEFTIPKPPSLPVKLRISFI